MTTPHQRLRELGITLPKPATPLASYVAARMVAIAQGRSLLYIAGQTCREGNEFLTGRCPDQVTVEEAISRARNAGLNVLAQIEAAAGLDNVAGILELTGWVLSADGFSDQPKVLNGASDLFVDVLGAAGRHTRVALGTNALPLSVTVEIAAVAVVRTS